MDYYKIATVVLPIVSAILASGLTYLFGLKNKRKEILLQIRLKAFEELSKKLNLISNYCSGIIAQNSGNEFAPFQEIDKNALMLREELAEIFSNYIIYFNEKAKSQLKEIIDDMSILCNIEFHRSAEQNDLYSDQPYENVYKKCQDLIKKFYEQLGFPK